MQLPRLPVQYKAAYPLHPGLHPLDRDGNRHGLTHTVANIAQPAGSACSYAAGMSESVSFDRIAKQYDATRGGVERGRLFAGFIAEHLVDGPVLEVGIGTGAIAAALGELGYSVLGVDISAEMLAQARERLGAAVVRGDAQALPFASAKLHNVVFVHVLHLVGDMGGALAEAARILRPGGRLVAFHGTTAADPDDIVAAMEPLNPLRERPDTLEGVAGHGRAAGLRVVAQLTAGPYTWPFSPHDFVNGLQGRQYPYLWGLDDATWQAVVEPVIATLRALPEPDRPRPQQWRTPLSVLSKDLPTIDRVPANGR
jgi:SAM-dependent methyltransferase